MFGCIVAGRLVQTNLVQVEVNKFVFEIPDPASIKHLVVFMLGTIPFEPGYGASVHLSWPNQEWQFLGLLGNDKPSAIFKLTLDSLRSQLPPETTVKLGISIEPLSILHTEHQASADNNLSSTAPAPMAQKVLDHLYNFISSFIDPSQTNAHIPLSAFNSWHAKFLDRLKFEPNFLNK